MTAALVWGLGGLLFVIGVWETWDRFRTRRRAEPYHVGVCHVCASVVRLGPDFRVLAHNPPEAAVHVTCMGSYLLPVTGTVEYVTEAEA